MDEWMGWNGSMADKLSGEQFSSENRDIIGRYGDQTRNDYGPGDVDPGEHNTYLTDYQHLPIYYYYYSTVPTL